ncbi:unnamed protein product [Triticum turgidum subsp. durum]|uniref:Uncharacterized protein n=2 Tax=Triticum TaxID=4564 RepID=A0A9R0V8A8_TRITD|nr:unnamed protein product [Triticum turgidum subsp. durum]
MRRPLGACGSRSSPAAAFLLVAAAICAQFATGFPFKQHDDSVTQSLTIVCMETSQSQPGLADDASKDESKGHTGQTVLFVLLGIGAAGLLSFFLFKYWQKKKREEQHARLLKLFEEDDDIEVELGLRD